MKYRDGQERETAKWAHRRIAREHQQAEEEQRRALADVAIDSEPADDTDTSDERRT